MVNMLIPKEAIVNQLERSRLILNQIMFQAIKFNGRLIQRKIL